ncbi:MAG: FkbM family methyltransferase [Planctomycetota bacterium]|nr:FkbM family methyltransferase [Planctomycetota bacterium]
MLFPLTSLFDDLPGLKLLDIGASPIDGEPPYQALYDGGRAELVGFEPDPHQFQALLDLAMPRAIFLPHALGDGKPGELKICASPGMTSLLEPDPEVLSKFHGFGDWGRVVKREHLETKRLDDIPEASGSDYMKIDVQGGELAVFEGGPNTMNGLSVVHTEVQFVPFYRDQPLFAELDQALRAAGFFFHRFMPIHSRVFKPMVINQDPYAGLSQELWSDAVYVRRFTDFEDLPVPQLLKIAVLLNDLYESVDLASLALQHVDAREGSRRQARYLNAIENSLA